MIPQFTRPENPVLIADPGELMRFLDQHNVDYTKWKNDEEANRFDEFWDEIDITDTLVSIERIPRTDITAAFRDIRTVTLRITYEKRDNPNAVNPIVLVLVEHRLGKDGAELPRKRHPESSVTEKMHWNKPGFEERPSGAIVRVFQEELGITLTHEHLQFFTANLFPVPAHVRRAMSALIVKGEQELLLDLSDKYKDQIAEHLERGIDLDVRWSSDDKYPGIVTRNQLVHYWLKLPADLYREEGYVENTGRFKSLWELSGT